MPYCGVCYKEIFSSKLKTISNQMVCSLSCVGLLESTEKDSCYYCHRPVWNDNYYKVEDKNFCSKYCKDKIIEELNISNDSEKIKHYNENFFININPTSMKTTKKLREEVLKLYDDFKFDNENIDINQLSNRKNSKYNCNDYIIKEYKSENKISNDYRKIKYSSNIKNPKDYKIDNYNGNKNILERINLNNTYNNLTEKNVGKNLFIKKKSNKSDKMNYLDISKTESTSIYKYKQKISDYYKENLKKYQTNNDSNAKEVKTNYNNYFNKKIANKLILNQYSFDYSYNNDKVETNAQNKNKNKSNDLSQYDYLSNKTYDKNEKYKIVTKRPIICKVCLRRLGNATFLDRNGNRFCSDECKNEFLNKHN